METCYSRANSTSSSDPQIPQVTYSGAPMSLSGRREPYSWFHPPLTHWVITLSSQLCCQTRIQGLNPWLTASLLQCTCPHKSTHTHTLTQTCWSKSVRHRNYRTTSPFFSCVNYSLNSSVNRVLCQDRHTDSVVMLVSFWETRGYYTDRHNSQ